MPGTLPANSGYTDALDVSADEAVAAGATNVTLTAPVPVYVDNFLGFAVGTKVPTGYYDQKAGQWVPATDGRVLKILSIAGGQANIDVTGSGVAADSATLAGFGIDPAERQQLATLYAAGKTLWRVPITHFTPWDLNWPFGFPTGAVAPNLRPLSTSDPTKNDCTGGSIIECENQTLGEEVAVAGTPFTLAYRSDRQFGRAANRSVRIPVTGASVPASLQQVQLQVSVAGQFFQTTLSPTANQSYTYTWNGLDGYGRPMQGVQQARVRVGYTYQAVYMTPAQLVQNFGQFSGVNVTTIWSRQQITAWQEFTVSILGGLDAMGLGLGGWTLSAQHFYDPAQQVLYLGTGERRSAQAIGPTITTVAGTPSQPGFSGDGGPATAAKLNQAASVARGPDGSLYISDYNNMRIRRVSPSGIITTVAGNGSVCCTGDGGPATQAGIGNAQRIAVASDGSILFGPYGIARVRKVTPDGMIATVAGTGTGGFSGDGGLATSAQISIYPRELLAAPDGGFYFADWNNNRVRRVSATGIISTIAGGGSGGDGGAATAASLSHPEGLAFGPNGDLYIQDGGDHRVRRVSLDGIIRTVWGTGAVGGGGDGGAGTQAQITFNAQGIDIASEGALFLADLDVCRVRKLGTDGIVSTIAGSGSCTYGGDTGPATQAGLNHPFDVAAAPDGSLYIADLDNHVVRRITPAFPGFSAFNLAVTSEDGTEFYQFDASGRHLSTRDARTGATLLTFGYDPGGKLVTVTDADGNVTTIQRDAQERPTGILGPFGQQTLLTVDGSGYLASVADPAGDVVKLYHESGATAGLLDSLADPRGYVHRFTYDNLGRLAQDADPAGGSKTLAAVQSDTGVAVTVTTALNHATAYQLDRLPDGSTLRRLTDPASLITYAKDSTDGTRRITAPDGTIVTRTQSADPRWGMQAPVVKTFTAKFPSGLTAALTGGRKATLSNPSDPFTLTTLTDSTIVNGQLFRNVYDQATRRFTATSPEGRQTFATIDTVGRIRVLRTSGLDSTVYTYDLRGRLSQVETGGRLASYRYDSKGRLQNTTDPLGLTDSLFYDTADRLTRHVLPGGRQVQFAYDSSGNLTGVTPPGRPQHGFGFTPVDLTTSYTPPNVGLATPQTTFSYNTERQLTRITRPDTSTIDVSYDNAGRPQSVTIARGAIAFSYSSSTGQLTTITAPGGITQSFAYDGLLVKQASWGTLGSVAVTYNSDLRVASQTVQNSTINLTYDHDGLLNAAGALGLKRNAQTGLVDRDSVQNALNVRTYDPKGDLASYTASVLGTTLFQTAYVRDSLGRDTLQTETIQGVTSTARFTYDSAGRLATVTRNGTLTASYQYDLNGNRLQLTTPNGTLAGTYDAQDRLTQFGSTNYGYNSAGDLRFKAVGSDTTWFTYDALGNLVAARLSDGTQLDYLIDGQNHRVSKKVNGTLVQSFLYQGQLAPAAELDGTGTLVSRFVYGTRVNIPDYMVKSGVTYRLILDQVGSVRLVVNATDGTVAQRIDYDEFGQVTQNTNPAFQPFGFAGGLLDQYTGLTRFASRDYDPYPGRWTTKDPAVFNRGETLLYGYAANDPVNSVDPTGLYTVQIGGTIGGVTGWFGWQTTIGLAIDSHGNLAVFATSGGGLGAGADFSLGLSGAFSNAETICQLRGIFASSSVGAGAGLHLTADTFSGPSNRGYVTGGGLTAGEGAGAGGFAGVTYTAINGPIVHLW